MTTGLPGRALTPGHASDDSALRAVGFAKQFGGIWALDGVDLTVAPGSVHALLGGNGSGKSTLIKALAGIQPADRGRLDVAGHSFQTGDLTPRLARMNGLRFVHQQLTVFPELTVAENLAIGHRWEAGIAQRIRWRRQRACAEAILDRFQIRVDPSATMGDHNVAIQTMVVAARAMQDLEHAGVLVLDEPTAAFPPEQVDLLLAFVRDFARSGHSVIYVTHRLDEVVRVADHATVLRDGRVHTTMNEGEITHRRLSEAIMGPAAMAVVSDWQRKTSEDPHSAVVSDLQGGAVSNASFALRPGEIVGVAGLLGSGRSTLLRLMFGAEPARGGTLSLDGGSVSVSSTRQAMRAGIAYIPEDRASDACFGELSVAENLAMATASRHFRRGYIDRRREASAHRQLMADYRVKAASPKAPLATLSGGNQQKVILARWLRREPRLLLLDEPTQGVDVGARAEIWQLVRAAVDRGACALVVTSDLEEMATFCDRALVMRSGRIVGEVAPDEMTDHNLQRYAFGLEETA